MLSKKLSLTIILFVLTIVFYGQRASSIPTPDFLSTPYLLAADSSLIELDDSKYSTTQKGMLPVKLILYTYGITSNLEISDTKPNFIFSVESGIDPRALLVLRKATVNLNAKRREFVFQTITGLPNPPTPEPPIEIKFKKIRDQLYAVTPESKLEPGEYFFGLTSKSNSTIYCFSIK
jgi:hypothetical protein